MNKVQEIIDGMTTADFPSYYWITADTEFSEFPELKNTKLTLQRNGQSVWEHTMSVMDRLAVKNPVTLLSGLFHDLGKACVRSINDPPSLSFPNHAIKSAGIAATKLKEWGATSDLTDRVTRIVLMHMYDISSATREKTICKFVANVGRNNVADWFTLRVADSNHCDHLIRPFKKAVVSYLENQPNTDDTTFIDSVIDDSLQIEGGND